MRLVGGKKPNQGRIEIHFGDQWSTICDRGWDKRDATVVCKQLGYQYGEAIPGGYYEAGTGDIAMDDVECNGREHRLTDCGFSQWYSNKCFHAEDAGVVCHSKS